MISESVLFSLLRLGLGTSTDIQKENISDLFISSEKEWMALEEIVSFQGVSGVALDGLQVIMAELGSSCFAHSDLRDFWQDFILQWIGVVEQYYSAGNMQQMMVVDNIQQKWAEAGIRMMLMKGQAIGVYYPVPNHRCPGDIDCYLFNDYAKGNEVAKKWADTVDEGWYKHSQIFYAGQLIENHQFFVHTREGKSSKMLEKLMIDELKNVNFEKLPETDVLLPPPMFNALFLTYHALSHFLEEGLKLKQLVDWAMFLNRDADKIDWPRFYSLCEKYHLKRFVDVATDVAVNYLGVKLDNPLIVTTSPYTRKVIHSTLYDKDYVFSSGQSGWANRWHIVKNIFKYRWKYNQIYQHSVLRQLWFFASGYLFKTE